MGHPGQTSLSERLRTIEAEIAVGQTDSALAHCQEVFAYYPRALAVQRVLGEIYLAQRKPREALGALDRALAGDPEDARACCARAIIHQMHGDQMAALAWYRRACDARPDDQTLRATYFETASRLGQPPYQPTRVGLARLYLRGGLFTHAIREWETLVAENSDLLEAQVGLVETLWRTERYPAAEEWARRVLMNAPSCVKPLLISGLIARETGREPDAARFLQRAAELDPDNRIARALFADRAMGDPSLKALFWGDDPITEVAPLQQAPTAGPQRTTGAPQRATAAPFGAPTNAQLTGIPSLADLGAALSRPDLSANLSRPAPQPSRPHNLTPEFHSMFKETENMLWGPEHSDPGALPTMAMPAPDPAGFRPQTAAPQPTFDAPLPQAQPPFEDSAHFVPPAILESQFALGDTEARRAIRWVQWLQAQGARMRSDSPQKGKPTGSLDALLNTGKAEPVAPPGMQPWPFGGPSELPLTTLPSSGPEMSTPPPTPSAPTMPNDQPSRAIPTSRPSLTSMPALPSLPMAPLSGPLTGSTRQPNAGDLRDMFAQLEPTQSTASGGSDLRDMFAQLEPAQSATGGSDLRDVFAQLGPTPAADIPAAPPTQPNIGQVEPAAEPAPEANWPAALADAFEWPSQPGHESGASPQRIGPSGPDITLEQLEDIHEASGFQPLDLEPGTLSAFTGAQPQHAESERAQALENFFQEPEVPPLPPTPEPEPEPQLPTISPTDYPARLAYARELRDAGSLDEALVEYRALLKNAPDLLADVKGDLESSLDAQPEHPEIHRLLGDARIRQGDYMAALESLNRSVSLTQNPEDQTN
ncbi:MAG TPA: tetratricopeptide repeat protein [Ktedonobacterales bacterium]